MNNATKQSSLHVDISIEIENAIRAIMHAHRDEIRKRKKSQDFWAYWICEGARRACYKKAIEAWNARAHNDAISDSPTETSTEGEK